MMHIIDTPFPSVKLIEPKIFHDARGFFFESFNQRQFCERIGQTVQFVQDNHSRSTRGVLRGLHYQIKHAQGKLVRVCVGEILDVAVDMRKSSPDFGKSFTTRLSAENQRQLWIPEGFAHGFLTLSETAEVLYKTTDYYAPEYDRSVRWNDPHFQINWAEFGDLDIILSEKDRNAPSFEHADYFA